MLQPDINTTPQPWIERQRPSELSRVPSRAPWWAPALAFSALTDLRWQRLLARADHDVLRDNLQLVGHSLASRTPLDLVVERSALDGQILKSWVCFEREQAQVLAQGFTDRGCLRSLRQLHLPKPYQGLDFWGRFMLVVRDRTASTAFYGPFGTREKAQEFLREHLEDEAPPPSEPSSFGPWTVVEVTNPFADLLADADNDIAEMLAEAWGASQGELMRLMRGGSDSSFNQELAHRPRSPA
jgi:hypothetical protein